MEKLILIIIAMFSISGSASAEDGDCVAGEAKPSFSAKTIGLRDYKVSKSKGENFVTETFKLKDGTAVVVSQGGCAHFDKSVSFVISSSKTSAQKIDSKFLITQARELIARLPKPNNIAGNLLSDLKEREKQLLEQDANGGGKKHEIEATDSDGFDTVRLGATEKGSSLELLVGVNTAL